MQDDGICQIKYQVDCSYDELQDELANTVASVQPIESTALVDLVETSIESNSEDSILSEFLWDLEEHYKLLRFN